MDGMDLREVRGIEHPMVLMMMMVVMMIVVMMMVVMMVVVMMVVISTCRCESVSSASTAPSMFSLEKSSAYSSHPDTPLTKSIT